MLVVNDIFFNFSEATIRILDYQVAGYENLWMSCSKLHLIPLSKITWSFKCVMLSLWNNTSSSSLALYNSLLCKVPQALLVSSENFFCLALGMANLARSTCISVHIQDDDNFDEALVGFLSFTYTPTILLVWAKLWHWSILLTTISHHIWLLDYFHKVSPPPISTNSTN